MMKLWPVSLPLSLRWFCSSLCLALALTGCGGSKKGGFDGATAPYGAITPTTQVHATAKFPSSGLLAGPNLSVVTSVVGQKTIGGASYDRLVTASVDNPTKNIEYLVKKNADETLDFAGVLCSSFASGLVPATSVTFTTPIKVNLDSPVGQPQTVTESGTLTLTDSSASSSANVTGTYTLLEKNMTVATGMGPLSGCSHFTGNVLANSAGLPAAFAGQTFTGNVWYHPSFGVVAFNTPELGIGTAMTDSSDCGSVDSSGYKIIRKVGVVDASSSFELGTYECDGNKFAADKNVEASMLLELRWADETLAMTDTHPLPGVEFGTPLGYFPNAMVESPTSIFHPEENGKGFKYWSSYVQQGHKNAPGDDSTAYHITVDGVAGLSPVRVTARIYYKVLQSVVAGLDGGGLADGGLAAKDAGIAILDAPYTPEASVKLDTLAISTGADGSTQANLLINGSFEARVLTAADNCQGYTWCLRSSDSVPGWTQYLDGVDLLHNSYVQPAVGTEVLVDASNGVQFVDMNQTSSLGGLYQVVSATPGAIYTLHLDTTAWAKNALGGTLGYELYDPSSNTVLASGEYKDSVGGTWITRTLSAAATSSQIGVRIRALVTTQAGMGLDNVILGQ
jgi:hypothetical protein